MVSSQNTTPLLEMQAISKQFPGVQALNKANLRLFPGEVHALMGQNGAGKSTLIKVLTGVEHADSGEIRLNNIVIAPATVHDAQKLGISTVYQEINLCPNLSVAENIYIGRFPMRHRSIAWTEVKAKARKSLTALNVDIDVTLPLSTYSVAIQQMVAIARALDTDARILVLDEPTSSLDEGEVARLFDALRQLKAKDIAILFITHFLEQTYAISDRITVLRNGEFVGEYLAHELPQLALIEKMVGHAIDESAFARVMDHGATTIGATLLHAKSVGRRGKVQPMDLELKPGEVLGLGGLLGSGRTETARLLFGIDRTDSGRIEIEGVAKQFRSPTDAIRSGIGFCPEDRKTEGIVADLSIRENIVIALQARRGLFRFIPKRRQREIADTLIAQLGIRTPDAEKPISQLSGGNQQKALLARWLATNPRILILDEPTRGVDVAAKLEIMDMVKMQCRRGLAILFISSEIAEVLRTADRIAVLRDRRKVGELDGAKAREEDVFRMIAGADS